MRIMKQTNKQLVEEFIRRLFGQYRNAIIEVKDKEKDKWDSFDWESALNFLLGDLERDIIKWLDEREGDNYTYPLSDAPQEPKKQCSCGFIVPIPYHHSSCNKEPKYQELKKEQVYNIHNGELVKPKKIEKLEIVEPETEQYIAQGKCHHLLIQDKINELIDKANND